MKSLDKLFQPWNRSDAPGLIVGVAHKGATIYRRGFGLASVEHATANTPQTKMRIGSTSKHFTSLAVLLLAEDGRRSEEHKSELQSLMRTSYAAFCMNKKKRDIQTQLK